jgi:hypothetical protein
LLLAPCCQLDPKLDVKQFARVQSVVYESGAYSIFDNNVPRFSTLLCIVNFFQHHLDHMRMHIGPAIRTALNWRDSILPGPVAFQPCPPVTPKDFTTVGSEVFEGEWIGLYAYLAWSDFESLMNGNPATRRAMQTGNLRDYLGGPQKLSINIPTTDPEELARDAINIKGNGINGGEFTFLGRLYRVRIPADVVGKEMRPHWRINFTKTYELGENSGTRWIYDGFYFPGKSPLEMALIQGSGSLDAGKMAWKTMETE